MVDEKMTIIENKLRNSFSKIREEMNSLKESNKLKEVKEQIENLSKELVKERNSKLEDIQKIKQDFKTISEQSKNKENLKLGEKIEELKFKLENKKEKNKLKEIKAQKKSWFKEIISKHYEKQMNQPKDFKESLRKERKSTFSMIFLGVLVLLIISLFRKAYSYPGLEIRTFWLLAGISILGLFYYFGFFDFLKNVNSLSKEYMKTKEEINKKVKNSSNRKKGNLISKIVNKLSD